MDAGFSWKRRETEEFRFDDGSADAPSNRVRNKNPAAPLRERRAHIVNMDISSKSRSTGQWALMGFLQYSGIFPILVPNQPDGL
ncbi:hypothetical protein K9U39_11045 [Rhodoblastus acidophilus]|uniref:hypothetical protein n=1 Tax=Candidatus Rhodoblastus alkanivorans TaxID=2954117 RepID=UPI001FA990E4|nr:hypothetical protein [Candidatus Rhodoblastus alkanivorans]MCI4680876.1 hypothetical protein [Candidatus Rhodoblastus alkanivorans]MDI4641468.1 hypothetical protein [Rhodoblastus acidophilus]